MYIGQIMQNADATTLCTRKVDDKLLSILTVATPGDLSLSCSYSSIPLSPMLHIYL
jgi:hypothetical protein